MGDLGTLAKARRELEELYSGIPDESVNLTFQDFAQLNHHSVATGTGTGTTSTITLDRKKSSLNPISEGGASSSLTKLPSLDFNTAFETSGSNFNHHHHQQHTNHRRLEHDHDKDHYHDRIMDMKQDLSYGRHHPDLISQSHRVVDDGQQHLEELTLPEYPTQGQGTHSYHHYHQHQGAAHAHGRQQRNNHVFSSTKSSMTFDDTSIRTGPTNSMDPFQSPATAAGRRRTGVPHSNICTICSVYIYMFRHRCLVCGRVYCRHCVSIGMGEMTEGRKCIECLGKRFSQRYIERAGKVGCWAGGCMGGYPSSVKLQEIRWAEKGPRRSGEKRYGSERSGMISRSRSPMAPRTPHIPSTPPSFVASSPYSPASYHLPL